MAPIEVIPKRWQVPNRARPSLVRVFPVTQRNSSLNPGSSSPGSSRSVSAPTDAWDGVSLVAELLGVAGLLGVAALVSSTGVLSVSAGLVGAAAVERVGAGSSDVLCGCCSQPARPRAAASARAATVAAGRVGRARARLRVTVFLTVSGGLVQRRLDRSDSRSPAVACPRYGVRVVSTLQRLET